MSAEDTRQRVLKTTRKLLSEKGYNDITVTEIIKESKTNKGSFYFHFVDKETITKKITFQWRADVITRIKQIFPENTELQNYFLFLILIWRANRNDESFRRLSVEFSTKYHDTTLPFDDIFAKIANNNKITYSEMLLIKGAHYSIDQHFMAYCCANFEKFDEREPMYFYFKMVLGLYQIPEDEIIKYVDDAYKQLDMLEITTENFIPVVEKKAL